MPLYVKAGAVLPVGPKVQFASEKKWDSLEIKVYPGADGSFTFYEDEFDNYNYEKGLYSEIEFTWVDHQKKLKISDRKGKFKGMLEERNFTILLADGSKKIISYNGKRTEVKF